LRSSIAASRSSRALRIADCADTETNKKKIAKRKREQWKEEAAPEG